MHRKVKLFSSKDVERFSKIEWDFSDNQLPVIEGAFAILECETFQTVEAGDHTILIGAVTNIRTEKRVPALSSQAYWTDHHQSFMRLCNIKNLKALYFLTKEV